MGKGEPTNPGGESKNISIVDIFRIFKNSVKLNPSLAKKLPPQIKSLGKSKNKKRFLFNYFTRPEMGGEK